MGEQIERSSPSVSPSAAVGLSGLEYWSAVSMLTPPRNLVPGALRHYSWLFMGHAPPRVHHCETETQPDKSKQNPDKSRPSPQLNRPQLSRQENG